LPFIELCINLGFILNKPCKDVVQAIMNNVIKMMAMGLKRSILTMPALTANFDRERIF